MPLERESSGPGLVDVLDRVLDKGIVIDASVRVSVVGVELLGVDARVVVASIETYLRHADTLAYTAMAAAPAREVTHEPAVFVEPVEPVVEVMPPEHPPARLDAAAPTSEPPASGPEAELSPPPGPVEPLGG